MEAFQRDLYDDGSYAYECPRSQQTNHLLVRKPLGQVKPSCYSLPGNNHTYGFVDPQDAEGAGDIVGSWQTHIPAPQGVPGKDFVRLNKYGAMSGCVTAKNVATFRRYNDCRVGEVLPPRDNIYYPDADTVYGRPSPASVPIADLINNSYQRKAITMKRARRADLEMRKPRKTNFTQTSHTRASLGHTKVAAPAPKPMFKMKKFQNVPSRVAQFDRRTSAQKSLMAAGRAVSS
jgi:hypothetical protein